jgi:hypothetical protein
VLGDDPLQLVEPRVLDESRAELRGSRRARGDLLERDADTEHPESVEHDEAVVGAPQHGGVEGAAAEVVDRDDLARVDPLARGVVHGRGFGLGDELRAGQAGELHGLAQQLDLVRPQLAGCAIATLAGGPP